MEEYIITINDLDEETGFVEKMEAHHKGVLHRAFSILVFNCHNQLLLQKRSEKKYHSPGLWTNTCCSHPRHGENLQDAIYRRLKEEMGVTCELNEVFSFIYKAELGEDLFEHEYDHVFFGVYDGEVFPDKYEVDDYRWMHISEIEESITNHPEIYTYWFKELFGRVEEAFNNFIKRQTFRE
ncbi:MAG: isopentenyl-diphosphate Delta-isomerase [Clostridiaceae bacterium]